MLVSRTTESVLDMVVYGRDGKRSSFGGVADHLKQTLTPTSISSHRYKKMRAVIQRVASASVTGKNVILNRYCISMNSRSQVN